MAKGGKRPGAGRPKGTLAPHTLEAQELRKRLIERAAEKWEKILDSLFMLAQNGDYYAIRDILDRVLGKATDKIQMESKSEMHFTGFENLTDEQLDVIITRLKGSVGESPHREGQSNIAEPAEILDSARQAKGSQPVA